MYNTIIIVLTVIFAIIALAYFLDSKSDEINAKRSHEQAQEKASDESYKEYCAQDKTSFLKEVVAFVKSYDPNYSWNEEGVWRRRKFSRDGITLRFTTKDNVDVQLYVCDMWGLTNVNIAFKGYEINRHVSTCDQVQSWIEYVVKR